MSEYTIACPGLWILAKASEVMTRQLSEDLVGSHELVSVFFAMWSCRDSKVRIGLNHGQVKTKHEEASLQAARDRLSLSSRDNKQVL